MWKSYIKDFILTATVGIVAFIFTLFSENSDSFLIKLPDLMGLILAGILSSLAIIFGLLSKDELIDIQKNL
jgi:hypothetical protein